MGNGYTRQSAANIIPGAVVEALPLNAEFNSLQSAFNQANGHSHDGTTGEGPLLSLSASTTGVLPINKGGTNSTSTANARISLGLEIGVNVQAWDAQLDDLALKTIPTGDLVGTTDIQTLTNKTLNFPTLAAPLATGTWSYSTNNFGFLADTVDAADNKSMYIAGGGAYSVYRGALVIACGNEHATNPGQLRLLAGSTGYISANGNVFVNGTLDATTLTLANELSVLNGGTGASTAATARTNLGVAIGTNVQAFDASLTSIAGQSWVAGDVLYFTGVDTAARLPKGAALTVLRMDAGGALPEWGTPTPIATQAQMETATSTITSVAPGLQHYHPGHPKFWAQIRMAAGAPSLITSYNVTSITDSAAGQVTVTINNDFSSNDWACVAMIYGENFNCNTFTKLAGSILITKDVGTTDPANGAGYDVVGFGDQ